MIVGDTARFAIQSEITVAYERLSFLALGCFTIHIQGRRFGVFRPDATMLACSFDEVNRRIDSRGTHLAESMQNCSAAIIADGFRRAMYGTDVEQFTTESDVEFDNTNRVLWAPDGDGAFDDGAYVLQCDFERDVRLIAFHCMQNGLHDPESLRDLTVSSDEFYDVLQVWRDAFRAEWMDLPKE